MLYHILYILHNFQSTKINKIHFIITYNLHIYKKQNIVYAFKTLILNQLIYIYIILYIYIYYTQHNLINVACGV